MQCKSCKKEFMESELKNGLCCDCLKKSITNPIAQQIKKIILFFMINGYLFGIICAIAFIVQEDIVSAIFFGYIFCALTWILSTILKAIPEALQLLDDIRNK